MVCHTLIGGFLAAATGIVVLVHTAVSLANRHPGKMNSPTGKEMVLATIAGCASGVASLALYAAFYF
jgi:hypothetical protein